MPRDPVVPCSPPAWQLGVATVASAVGRANPVQANTGDPLYLGVLNSDTNGSGVNEALAETRIGSPSSATFSAVTSSSHIEATGVTGLATNPTTPWANGVAGYSDSSTGRGVFGLATTTVGSAAGVRGETRSADGVGVEGHAMTQALGEHGAGLGVFGQSRTNAGVFGKSDTSNGVSGTSVSGNGVYATTSGTGSALNVAGKAKFSRSGRATVAANRSYVDITVAGGLTSRSVVHATLQTYRTGVSIAAVRPNYPTAGKARIYLTKVASTTAITYVGWFVAEY